MSCREFFRAIHAALNLAAFLRYDAMMIARSLTLAERFGSPPAQLLDGRWQVARFTRADAQAMVRLGIIPEDASTELLSGLVVLKDRSALGQDPTMIGQDHRKCVERLSTLRKSIDNDHRHVESQQPLVCSDTHVPEPDFMILRGTLAEYSDLPTAADAYCVVEVADSSYERDAGEKLIGYARAGVAQYVILNLRNGTAEVYTLPDAATGQYRLRRDLNRSAILPIRVGEEEFHEVSLVALFA